jgi:hypothetical protein
MNMVHRSDNDLVRIGEIISESSESGFLGLVGDVVRVFQVWEAAVGAYNAARTKPESIKNGRLTVIVPSPVWIDRFSYLKAQFIEKINQTLGAPMVKELIFKVGVVAEPGAGDVRSSRSKSLTLGEPPVTPSAAEAVAMIKDPDLKGRLVVLLSRQNASRKESR